MTEVQSKIDKILEEYLLNCKEGERKQVIGALRLIKELQDKGVFSKEYDISSPYVSKTINQRAAL